MTARIVLAVAAIGLVLAASAAAAQSPQQKATTFVCGARAAIGSDVDAIKSDVGAPGTAMAITAKGTPPPFGSLRHIVAELAVIRLNLAALPPGTRLQATRAAAAFASTLVPISRGLSAAPTGATTAPPVQVKLFTTAQAALFATYTKTLGALSC